MARYAASTDVTADRSRNEIDRTLARYGAISFMYGWDEGRAILAFAAHNRQVRFVLPMPDRGADEFFDEEFLAHFVLPGGGTVAEQVIPRVDEAYQSGRMVELLPPTRPAIEAGESQ